MTRKKIIINGCTRGLGLSLIKLLSKDRMFEICCFVRNIDNLKNLKTLKSKLSIFQCDYSNIKEANNSVSIFRNISLENCTELFFINNFSILQPIGKIGRLNSEEINKNITTNIVSNLVVLNNFLDLVLKKEIKTYILNISSGISKNPVPGLCLYGLAKSYMDYLTILLNKECAVNDIKIASFHPGGMKTDMQNQLKSELKSNKDLIDFNYNAIYEQKLLHPDSVAKIIYENYLINDLGWQKEISKIYDY